MHVLLMLRVLFLIGAASAWTMYMDKSYQAILANKLAPAIKAAGFSTAIWAYDHNTDNPDYPQCVALF